MTDSPLTPGTARYEVLAQTDASHIQSQWNPSQLALHTGLTIPTVVRALLWLRAAGLVSMRPIYGQDPLYEITTEGRQALNTGVQLALGS